MKARLIPVKQSDLFLYGAVLTSALIMKAFFSTSTVDQLKFILYPVSVIVQAITETGFHFVEGSGYEMNNGFIVIDKTCSGLNFFIIASCMSCFLIIPVFDRLSKKIASVTTVIFASFVLTLLVNRFRISTAIFLLHHLGKDNILNSKTGHHIQGIIFYFSFLIFYYLIFNHFIKNSPELKAPKSLITT